MSSLTSRIVKSIAVVDSRPESEKILMEPDLAATRILKQGRAVAPVQTAPPRTKQSYVDELNRVRVEIAQAKAELRTVTRELEEARGDIEMARAILSEDSVEAENFRNELMRMKQQAEEESSRIIEQATAEGNVLAEKARQDGYLEGFSKGYEEAANEFRAENEPKARQLEEMLTVVNGYREHQIETNETDLIRLCMSIAHKVICRELSTAPEAVVDMLYEVLDHNRREEFIRISISNDLMPIDVKAGEEIRNLLTSMGANVKIIVDGELPDGSAIVETPKGFTDVSIATQLNNIEEGITAEP